MTITTDEVMRNSMRLHVAALEAACAPLTQNMDDIRTDTFFWAPSLPILERVLREDAPQVREYTEELYDCDDFAFTLKAKLARQGITAVGVVLDFSGEHAYNVAATLNPKRDKNGRLTTTCVYRHFDPVLIEPQGNKIITKGIGEGQYKADMGLVIW